MGKTAVAARQATLELAVADSDIKNGALGRIAEALFKQRDEIFAANSADISKAREKGLPAPMTDRLVLNNKRVAAMAEGVEAVAALPDPVGRTVPFSTRPNGLRVEKMRVPLGVIGIVYESRPNVTADAAALCLKSGNAVILRGGSEALNSNIAIGEIIRNCLREAGIAEAAVSVIPNADRGLVLDMLKLDGLIDLIIPRGGQNLIEFVSENSSIPVLKHYKGVCHIFVDSSAQEKMAVDICVNAKTQRPGVCNAMETMLVHESIAPGFLPAVWKELKKSGVSLKGCEKTVSIIPEALPASEEDWDTEYLAPVLNIRVVGGIGEAVEHIALHGSMHTDCIITEDNGNASRFLREVDSSAVMHNASTRFNDGFELGMGAEIGISTTKIHAFGPMGLEELTSEKFVIRGNGQVRK